MNRKSALLSTAMFTSVILALASGAAHTSLPNPMDVACVEIYADVSRFDGIKGANPYSFQVTASGTRIASVTVQTPNGGIHSLSLQGDDDEWQYIKTNLADLCAMKSDSDIGFGKYIFTFTDSGGNVDTARVVWDPTCTDPHSGYADVTSPTNGQVGVPPNATLKWTCASLPCGNYAWYMELFPTMGPGASYEADILDPSATSWTPGPLTPCTDYRFWISAGTILGGGVPQTLMTKGGDDFVYAPGFETINEIEFTTQPGAVSCDSDPNNVALASIDDCVGSDGSLILFMTNATANKGTYPLISTGTNTIVNPPGATGTLCVGGTIGRYSQDVMTISSNGGAQLNLMNATTGGGNGGIPNNGGNLIGGTWNCQWWYRHQNTAAGSRFSSLVTFGPVL